MQTPITQTTPDTPEPDQQLRCRWCGTSSTKSGRPFQQLRYVRCHESTCADNPGRIRKKSKPKTKASEVSPTPPDTTTEYWRGYAEGYREAVKQLLPEGV